MAVVHTDFLFLHMFIFVTVIWLYDLHIFVCSYTGQVLYVMLGPLHTQYIRG